MTIIFIVLRSYVPNRLHFYASFIAKTMLLNDSDVFHLWTTVFYAFSTCSWDYWYTPNLRHCHRYASLRLSCSNVDCVSAICKQRSWHLITDWSTPAFIRPRHVPPPCSRYFRHVDLRWLHAPRASATKPQFFSATVPVYGWAFQCRQILALPNGEQEIRLSWLVVTVIERIIIVCRHLHNLLLRFQNIRNTRYSTY